MGVAGDCHFIAISLRPPMRAPPLCHYRTWATRVLGPKVSTASKSPWPMRVGRRWSELQLLSRPNGEKERKEKERVRGRKREKEEFGLGE